MCLFPHTEWSGRSIECDTFTTSHIKVVSYPTVFIMFRICLFWFS
jgi:hypothetical protein